MRCPASSRRSIATRALISYAAACTATNGLGSDRSSSMMPAHCPYRSASYASSPSRSLGERSASPWVRNSSASQFRHSAQVLRMSLVASAGNAEVVSRLARNRPTGAVSSPRAGTHNKAPPRITANHATGATRGVWLRRFGFEIILSNGQSLSALCAADVLSMVDAGGHASLWRSRHIRFAAPPPCATRHRGPSPVPSFRRGSSR